MPNAGKAWPLAFAPGRPFRCLTRIGTYFVSFTYSNGKGDENMNCLYLLLLLCCCSRSNQCCTTNNGCMGECSCRRNTPPCCEPIAPRSGAPRREEPSRCGTDMRNMGHVHEEIRRAGAERDGGCPCQDKRPEPPCSEPGPRPDQPFPRPFPPFADGPSCGCDDN